MTKLAARATRGHPSAIPSSAAQQTAIASYHGIFHRYFQSPRTLQDLFPTFHPVGLTEFLELERERTNDRAMSLVSKIERILNQTVVAVLKENLGIEGDQWWYEGVPPAVRTAVTKVQEDDKNSRGRKDAYLNLIHYRDIITNKWAMLGSLLGYGKTGKKDVRTAWLVEVNKIRQVAAHASSGAAVSWEQLSQLEHYLEWLREHVTAGYADEEGEAEDPETSLDTA